MNFVCGGLDIDIIDRAISTLTSFDFADQS